jgi:hypothetical protein
MRHKPHSELIARAVAKFDNSPTKLATAIGGGCVRQHVEHWLKDTSAVPERFARPIHDICLAEPACWDFYPDNWWRIWPDLRGLPGAPAISESPVHHPALAQPSQGG